MNTGVRMFYSGMSSLNAYMAMSNAGVSPNLSVWAACALFWGLIAISERRAR